MIFFLAAFLLAVTLTLNLLLFILEPTICHKIDAAVPWSVSVGRFSYLPPNYFLFREITLRETPCQQPAVRIARAVIRVSIRDFLFKQRLSPASISISRPCLDPYRLEAFLGRFKEDILAFWESFPVANLGLKVNHIRWNQPKGPVASASPFFSSFHMVIRDQNLWVKVAIEREMKKAFKIPFMPRFFRSRALSFKPVWACCLEGRLESQGLTLKALTLRRNNFFVRLWGQFRDHQWRLNGFGMIRTGPEARDQDGSTQKQPGWDQWFRQQMGRSQPRIGFDPDFFLTDLQVGGRLQYPYVYLDKTQFSLNNLPVDLTGRFSLQAPFDSDFKLILRPPGEKTAGAAEKAPTAVDLTVQYKGRRQAAGYIHHAEMDVNLPDTAGAGWPLDSWGVSLQDFHVALTPGQSIDFFVPRAVIHFGSESQPRRLELDHIQAGFIYRTSRYNVIQLKTPLYGGSLFGRMWMDKTSSPSALTSVLVLRDVRAHLLEAFLPYFTKVRGCLSGRIAFQNRPDMGVSGKMFINSGRLNDLEFFKWLAETFSLPSLRQIVFKDLAMDFFATPAGYGLDDIRLRSDEVELDGHFHVGADRFVDSKISLSLGRKVLKESPRFTRLLRMFERDVPSLVFDIKMSGPLDAMNFQWLQSTFKDRIRHKIPDFIERKIEREIDAILEPVDAGAQTSSPKNKRALWLAYGGKAGQRKRPGSGERVGGLSKD